MNYCRIGDIKAKHRQLAGEEASHNALKVRPLRWNLQYHNICASTEREIDQTFKIMNRLNKLEAILPYAVIAYRQRYSYGQKNRQWKAPIGGVWCSVAFPWNSNTSLPLAVIQGLSLEFEKMDIHVQFKWPNDLLISNRKLVGILPRLVIYQNNTYIAKVGIGINVKNTTPVEGINLSEVTKSYSLNLENIVARVLRGVEWSIQHIHDKEFIRQAAEKRLIGLYRPFPCKGLIWKVIGLDDSGGIVLRRNQKIMVYKYSF